MNTQIVKKVTMAYDILVPEDRFLLISRYVKENAEVDVQYHYKETPAGPRPNGASILENGEPVLTLSGEGYVPLQIAETFKADVLKAIKDGLDSVRPATTPKKKATSTNTGTTGGKRGKPSKADTDEIAALSLLGMTKEEIAAKVQRSVDTVAKYMVQQNAVPVGQLAEDLNDEDEDSDVQDSLEDEEFDMEEEEIEILS